MIRRAAYALFAALCSAAFATAAQANVTYTWQTLSSSNPQGTAPYLQLSFTVAGPVSVNADSQFAGPNLPIPVIPYPFPSNLVSFYLNVGSLNDVTLSAFTSEKSPGDTTSPGLIGFPQWNFTLGADPSAGTANLALFYIDPYDTYGEIFSIPVNGVCAAPGLGGCSAEASTNAISTIDYTSDDVCFDGCTYTGMLVATGSVPMSGPPSFWVLLAGIGILGLVCRRAGRGSGGGSAA